MTLLAGAEKRMSNSPGYCVYATITERKREMKKSILRRIFAGLLAGAMLIMAASCAQNGNSSGTASEGGGSSATDSKGEGDSNFNKEGWPVVNEQVTLKVYGSRNSNTFEDWNDFIMIQEMEETTNVHIEWELVESSTYGDTRAIKLTSGCLLYTSFRSSMPICRPGRNTC